MQTSVMRCSSSWLSIDELLAELRELAVLTLRVLVQPSLGAFPRLRTLPFDRISLRAARVCVACARVTNTNEPTAAYHECPGSTAESDERHFALQLVARQRDGVEHVLERLVHPHLAKRLRSAQTVARVKGCCAHFIGLRQTGHVRRIDQWSRKHGPLLLLHLHFQTWSKLSCVARCGSNCSPIACGTTRMSEKMIAASRSKR